MTPAQLDKLRRIDAHLANLLSTAEKRTPGEWETDQRAKRPAVFNTEGLFIDTNMRPYDASFIASCAGNAEAGWKSTRAMIALLLSMGNRQHDIETAKAGFDAFESILAAFPLETLNPKQP